MTLQELDIKKSELTKEVNALVSLKKELYSNASIETAMSSEEKELTNKISSMFGEINTIIKQKRSLN